jgi:hypothetical protein
VRFLFDIHHARWIANYVFFVPVPRSQNSARRLASDIQLVSMKVSTFLFYETHALTLVQQFMSQSASTSVLSVISKLPSVFSMRQVLPSVQAVSQNKTPPSSCHLPSVIPIDAATECMLCSDGQLITVARSSISNTAIYYRVVFHGSSCGPWLRVSPPAISVLADRPIESENLLRLVSAEYTSLMLLPAPGPVSSSVIADRQSSQSARVLHLSSLAAAAAAFVNYPATSSFMVSHTPLLERMTSQPLRSRIIVGTSRPLLLPGRVSWHVSSDIAVINESTLRILQSQPLLHLISLCRWRRIRANLVLY